MKENYYDENNPGVDVPIKDNNELKNNNKTTKIPKKKVNKYEDKVNFYKKMGNAIYKYNGFYLLIGCGLTYLLIVILDTIFSNALKWETSELTEGFLELVKFVISTLMGYVFSETKKNENDEN